MANISFDNLLYKDSFTTYSWHSYVLNLLNSSFLFTNYCKRFLVFFHNQHYLMNSILKGFSLFELLNQTILVSAIDLNP